MDSELIVKLVHHFYNGNLDFCLKLENVKMDWLCQQSLLNATVNNDLIKQYPICNQFTKRFLKKIIDFLEVGDSNEEIHDDLYSALCTAISASPQEFYYRHYIIGKSLSKIITMKETRNMVVNGTTGLKTWEAALVLSDWALCNEEIFSGKTVLELGSGVGFAGIAIGKMCDVKSIFLTDCHKEVLKTINENILINFTNFDEEVIDNVKLHKSKIKSIGVMMLDWNDINNTSIPIKPDVIIGADIVYDPTLLKSLCEVLQKFCSNKNLEIYIASIIRNDETFNSFLKTLDSMHFTCEKIEVTSSVFIEWDNRINKCLLKIKPK